MHVTLTVVVKLIILFSFIYLTVSMEFFDDITIPYEYLQQPSKLYPLSIILIGLYHHQLYKAPPNVIKLYLRRFSSFLESHGHLIQLPCDAKRTYNMFLRNVFNHSTIFVSPSGDSRKCPYHTTSGMNIWTPLTFGN